MQPVTNFGIAIIALIVIGFFHINPNIKIAELEREIGTPEMARQLMDIGFLISFAGNVTFKKAENLRESAKVVPLDKLLVETDCPFLTPVPFRGKRNEPAFVEHTARFLAEFYGVSFEMLAEHTTRNFLSFFKLQLAA